VPPVRQLAQPVLAREQVGAPYDQGQLGDLGRLDLLPADGDPPRRAVLRDADAVDQGQAQPDGGHREQRVGEGTEQPRRRAGRRPHQRQPDGGAEQLLLEVGVRRKPGAQVGDGCGGLHHDQAQAKQQDGDAEDQVVRRERPVEQPAPGPDPVSYPAQARHARPGGLRLGRGVRIRVGQAVSAAGNLEIHDSSLFAGPRQDPDIRRVSAADFDAPGRGPPGAGSYAATGGRAVAGLWHHGRR
jgi:hypothetical protein